jgi:hypothetical protein
VILITSLKYELLCRHLPQAIDKLIFIMKKIEYRITLQKLFDYMHANVLKVISLK